MGARGFSLGNIFRSYIAVRELYSISDEISMSAIHRFREQKMLKLLHLNAFWVNKRRIFVLFNSAGARI